MLPNFVLVGFMGSGKSSVGRHLAALVGHRFLDTDELIVDEKGCPITRIFADEGEAAFRAIEARVLRDLVGVCGIVLATGGGIVLDPFNRERMREIGIVAWLDADAEVLYERVSRNRKRPLLQTEDPRAAFDSLLAARQEVYTEASDFRVDSTGLTHEMAAKRIFEQAMRFKRAQDSGCG